MQSGSRLVGRVLVQLGRHRDRHADVARERHARAVQDAAERSQREAAALHLHLGQAEQAASALGELDSWHSCEEEDSPADRT